MKNSGVKIMKKKITFSILFIFAMIMSAAFAGNVSAQTAPSLGSAESFAVLGATTVTNTGLTVVTGDLGVSPGTAVTGFSPGVVVGTIFTGAGSLAGTAQIDATTAYANLAVQACNTILTGQDLGGLVLGPGVYCFSSSAQLTGTLTLDAQGNPNAVFIFQIGSTLTTASNSQVVLINGAQTCNVFYQVGSSATLGTGTQFQGNILALASITLTTGASVSGKVFALNGAVTLDTNSITNCLAPTAAPVSISGRVISPFGRGIAGARIFLTNSMGEKQTAMTNRSGYFSFKEIGSGENYVVEITHKSYIFTPQVLLVTNDLTELNFTGLPYGKSGGKSKFIHAN